MKTDNEFRTLSPSQILNWAETQTGIMRLRTERDVVPGGYMAALMPALVDWPASEIAGEGAHVILRNVNYGSNQMERTTILHAVRVPLEAGSVLQLSGLDVDGDQLTASVKSLPR